MSVITVKRPQVSVPTISTFVARLHSHALVFTLQWWPEFPQHLPFRECGFVITIVGHWNSTVQSTAEGMSFSTGQTLWPHQHGPTMRSLFTALSINTACVTGFHTKLQRPRQTVAGRHLLLRAEDWQIKQKSFLATSRLQLVLGTKSKLQCQERGHSFHFGIP